MNSIQKIFFIAVLLFSPALLFAQAQETEYSEQKIPVINLEKLPEIPRLSSYEIAFKEYSKLVESNYRDLNSGREPDYLYFKYKNSEYFTLQGLAARCNIPYDTLATLNHLESAEDKILNQTLILPSVPGIYIPLEKGNTGIEILLQENYADKPEALKGKKWIINGRTYVFLKNKRFSSTERGFFLDSSMMLPIDKGAFWVSSEFGKRKNPFSGVTKNHNGIDLAAPEGTPVYAIKDGAVAYTIENDPEFGNYIILTHDTGKITSVYAHLKSICVDQYKSVRKGDVIGFVGNTGKATGHHLHFEIRQGGKAQDPRSKLNLN